MLDDEVSLIKWMVSGPEISRLIYEFKETSAKKEDLRHHEDSKWFQSKFVNDVRNLVKTLRSKDPFRTTELSTIGHEIKLMNADSTKSVMAASELGSTVSFKTKMNSLRFTIRSCFSLFGYGSF